MNNEKEIKRMAEIVKPFITVVCEEDTIAEALYNAGYGNVKQAVKEFAERLKEIGREAEYGVVFPYDIDSLITEPYGADE